MLLLIRSLALSFSSMCSFPSDTHLSSTTLQFTLSACDIHPGICPEFPPTMLTPTLRNCRQVLSSLFDPCPEYLATPMSPVSNSRRREAPWVVVAHGQACTFISHATLKMTDRSCLTYAIILDKYCVRNSLHDIRTSISFQDVDVRVLCGHVRVFVFATCMFCAHNCAWCVVVSRC